MPEKPYVVQLDDIREKAFDQLKENLIGNGIKIKGSTSEYKQIRNQLFNEAVELFNKNPKKWLRDRRYIV